MRTERRPTSLPPSREAPEQVIVRLRRSGRHLVWPAIFFVALCFGVGYWWNRFPAPWLNTALPIVAAGPIDAPADPQEIGRVVTLTIRLRAS